jgi:C4-dicarboxylate-specific signal transduction histidine kinase
MEMGMMASHAQLDHKTCSRRSTKAGIGQAAPSDAGHTRATPSRRLNGEIRLSALTAGARSHSRPAEVPADPRWELTHTPGETSLADLTATIVHEVNQPLAAIITTNETALRWLACPVPNLEKLRELANRTTADARRACQIIDRIRAAAIQQPPERAYLSLSDVIEESMVFLRHEFLSKGVSVSLETVPALPQIVGDRTQLQQVVVNLILNAVEALTLSGASRRNILVRNALSRPDKVCCTIEDSGPGVKPAHLPHLFDRFFTTKDAGMGLGLHISRSIIEAHGGHICVDNDSALGGAKFSIYLPAAPATCARPA